MPLGFLVPAFLAAFAAAAVPIVLHLKHRERERPRRFPSLMFLQRIPIRTARHRRVADWPLLLLRIAAVSLLVLAFARPFFAGDAAVAGAVGQKIRLVLLDRSLSMSHGDTWSVALDSVRAAVADLTAGDRAGLILFDEEAEIVQPLTADFAGLPALLTGIKPSARGTRYAAALRAARQHLIAANVGRAELVIVSDLQRSGVTGLAGLELPAGIVVRTVPIRHLNSGNTAVTNLEVQRSGEAAAQRATLAATIMTRGLGDRRTATVTLKINDRPSGTRTADLPTDGTTVVTFESVTLPGGSVRVEVAVEPDDLPGDDSYHGVISGRDEARIVLVAPGEADPTETLFLERALAIGRDPTFRVERRQAGTLTAQVLVGTAAVVLFDVPVPPGGAGQALTTWVQNGGGVVQAIGRRLRVRSSEAGIFPAALRGEIDRRDERGGVLGDIAFEHPVFLPFRSGNASALGVARFVKYSRTEATTDAQVLARFDDGQPALLERGEGSGRAIMAVVPLDDESGDFPLQPGYLPFLRRLMLYTAGYVAEPISFATGMTWAIKGNIAAPVVEQPDGELLRPGSGGTLLINQQGYYQAWQGQRSGEPAAIIGANPPSRESDLTAMDPRELLLGVGQDSLAEGMVGAAPSQVELESRQGVWKILLLIAALLLLGEIFMASSGWRGRAARVPVITSERT